MRRLIISLANFTAAAIAAACLSSCGQQTSQTPLSSKRILLDTVVEVTLYSHPDQGLMDECFAHAEALEKILSRTIPGSDVARINEANGSPVSVSDETMTVLRAALRFGELSGGLFDVTIAPAVELWDFKTEEPAPPDPAALKKAAALVDYRKIQIENDTVMLPAGMALDLGGIAKGYIGDQMAALLRDRGVTSALLNLGGDVIAIGSKPDGKPFNIGIQDPFEQQGRIVHSLPLTNGTIATSGIYERSFVMDGTVYHHILLPESGMPIQNNIASATVYAETAMEADALATISVLSESFYAASDHPILLITRDGTIKSNAAVEG